LHRSAAGAALTREGDRGHCSGCRHR
jgi:hypothetical protein